MTEPKPSPETPARSEAETHKTSGRIAFDKRGNPVWEWALKTGIFGRDVDTQRLKALEAKDLRIVEEPKKAAETAKPGTQAASKPAVNPSRDKGGGMNPYDNTSPVQQKVLSQLAQRDKPAAKPEPRQPWWKKLFGRSAG